jgi:hypothetical protein
MWTRWIFIDCRNAIASKLTPACDYGSCKSALARDGGRSATEDAECDYVIAGQARSYKLIPFA